MLLAKLNNFLKSSFRLMITVMVCGVLFISSAYPAQATPSKATDGEASLNRIQNKTDDEKQLCFLCIVNFDRTKN